jgi:hypothetical protein
MKNVNSDLNKTYMDNDLYNSVIKLKGEAEEVVYMNLNNLVWRTIVNLIIRVKWTK